MAPAEAELRRALFGRRQGRKLRPAQRELLETWLPRLRLEIPPPPEPLDLDHVFAAPKGDCWLEIGFGGGEHLVGQAKAHPDVGFLGCEPFEDGVVKLLSAIEGEGLANIKVWAGDARPLLRSLPPTSIGRAFILFPDPWPKKRHHKRRLVSAATLAELARILRPGGELRVATDVGEYAAAMLDAALHNAELRWTARSPQDWRVRPSDWPQTRYEVKATGAGRRCYFFRFARV
jgi:tRNA (guanine-N7-)-methyltransferase